MFCYIKSCQDIIAATMHAAFQNLTLHFFQGFYWTDIECCLTWTIYPRHVDFSQLRETKLGPLEIIIFHSGSIYHMCTTYDNREFKRKREVSKSVKRKEKLRDPRCQLGYGSRKPKIHDSRNFLETLELYLGKSDCF